MNEEIIFVGSAVAGSLLTIAIDRLVKPALFKASKDTPPTYDSVRTELNSLEFEKNLAAESAVRVDAAFKEKKIDVYERDKLLQRYTMQIEQYEKKIDKYQNLLDFADLRNQRDNLTELMNRRIASIDQRLKYIHNKFAITYGGREDMGVELELEKAVQKGVDDNLHNPKPIDDLRQFTDLTPSTHNLSQPLVDDRPQVNQLEELHHQIMLELDRLEHDEKHLDEAHADDDKNNPQGSALNQDKSGFESIPGHDEGSTKEKKEPTSSPLGELQTG